MGFSVEDIRKDFAALNTTVGDKPLVYFDSGATILKPKSVADVIDRYYRYETASINRGVHDLSAKASVAYDGARQKLTGFIGAGSQDEVIFTAGTTASINLVARSYVPTFLKEGDEILITTLEHHANIVSWQLVAKTVGAVIKEIPITDDGEIDIDAYKQLLTSGKVKIVAMAHVSNVLGTVLPVKEMTALAHDAGAVVLVDGAQAPCHVPIDVQDLDCDFYALSGHKMLAATGCGLLYGKSKHLAAMPPIIGGGAMIERVTLTESTFREAPAKFEAGTPNISGVLSMGAAVDYLNALDFADIHRYEQQLSAAFFEATEAISGMHILGRAKHRAPVFAFTLDCAHPHDIGTLLNSYGIAVRTGHHCAQPLMARYKVSATTRACLSFFNTEDEIHTLVEGLRHVQKVFA